MIVWFLCRLDTLSDITTASLGTAKDNTAQIERWEETLLSVFSVFMWRPTAAMLVSRTIAKIVLVILWKTWATFRHCFVHQHGLLITWAKNKNLDAPFLWLTTRNLSSRDRQLFKCSLYFSLLQAYKQLNQILWIYEWPPEEKLWTVGQLNYSVTFHVFMRDFFLLVHSFIYLFTFSVKIAYLSWCSSLLD